MMASDSERKGVRDLNGIPVYRLVSCFLCGFIWVFTGEIVDMSVARDPIFAYTAEMSLHPE